MTRTTRRTLLLATLALFAGGSALSETLTGSGGVRYCGDPKVERRVAGSGDVRRLGANPT